MAAIITPLLDLTKDATNLAGYALVNTYDVMTRLRKNPDESPVSATKRAFKASSIAARQAAKDVCTWIYEHPMRSSQVISYYGAPVVAPYFAGSMMAAVGVGQLAPVAAIVASSFAKFRMRQVTAGTFYALLQSAGLGSVAAQAMSMAGFLSLSGIGPNGQKAQEWLISTAYKLGGFQTPIVGISVSIMGTLMGSIGMLPAVDLAGGAMSSVGVMSLIALWAELRSLAMFSALKWMKEKAVEKFQHCIAPIKLLEEWCSDMTGSASTFFKGWSLPLKGLESNWRHLIYVAKSSEQRQLCSRYAMKAQRIEENFDEWEMMDVDVEDEFSVISLAPETPSSLARFTSRSTPAPLLVKEDDEVESVFINWDHVLHGGLAAQGAFPENLSEVSYFIDCGSDCDNETLQLFSDDEEEAAESENSCSNDGGRFVACSFEEEHNGEPSALVGELCLDIEIWAST
ncbi:hypothetical protein BDV96DRAFT_645133 [Lophiotrema nucula]|uniref:Uncharacterized protein n=1 Tax=Lophiotrema nucula TaxID=690887 RepID=A0A6A5ZB84_9PLEO|nr:hypothetical protein BDV96DRAFT_645133 [Lophiotrema nucula]